MTMKNVMKKKRLVLAIIVSGVFLATPFVPIVQVSASTPPQNARNEVCLGLGGCPDAEAGVQGIVDDALNILSIIIGIAGVIMVMLGGFRYVTSGGDASKTSSAQNTIIWALVGLAVAALAQVIVRFVLGKI